jgi:hypothetical protein
MPSEAETKAKPIEVRCEPPADPKAECQYFLNGSWPEFALIAPLDGRMGIVTHCGETIQIELANGRARYQPVEHLPNRGWVCRLVDSSNAEKADHV